MTDHTELRRKAEENLEIEEGHSQMLEFGHVATARTIIALLDEIDALKAAHADMVLVPRVPTDAMLSVMADTADDPNNERSSWDLAGNMYRAMIEAATKGKS